ncbi:porin PorA family protein, partial [Streptomonospora algeriensis]
PRRRANRLASAALARNARLLALAAAVFLLTSALLLRSYVADELEKIPARIELTMRLTDDSAAYLDGGTWEVVRDVPVERLTEVSGSFAPGSTDWTTWQMSTAVSSRGTPLAHSERRVVVDRETGTAANCCGEYVDGDRRVRQAGLVLQWPAGGSWDEYPFYDADIRAAPPMVFDGNATVGGLFARRYVQTVEAAQVPGSAR